MGLPRGNKPDRFTANFGRLNAPKCSRVFLRHPSVIMAPEHGGRSVAHEIIKVVYIMVSLGGLGTGRGMFGPKFR
jgi:hypothetical protein